MRFNTGNPVEPNGSSDPRDLYDTAAIADLFVNGDALSVTDRRGQQRKSIKGMETDFSALLLNSGFESVHLAYVVGTPLSVARQTQLIDYAGSVYRAKLPASFPLTLSGTWADDQGLLVDVGDQALREAIAAATGAGMSGYSGAVAYPPNTVGSALKEVERRSGFEVHFDDFAGVVGNNGNDDTAGMQAAILAVATAGGGTVRGSFNKTYYVPGTLLTASNVTIDFGGAKVRSNRAGNTKSTFATATLEAGLLVDNRLAADDIKLVEFAHICNLRAVDAYCLFDFKNWIIGCSVKNVRAIDCRNVITAKRCFYSRWENITAVGSSLSDVATYDFKAQNNAIYLNRLSAITQFGFAFTGGSSAVHLDTCTYEGGRLGFYLDGENHAFKWTNLYSEAVQGTLFNFADCTYLSYSITGSYLNYIDVVLVEPAGPGIICEGTWDLSNDLVNIGATTGGFTYRGLIYKNRARGVSTMDLPTSFGAEATLPAHVIRDTGGMCTARKISVREGIGAGDVLSKAILLGGVIPLHYTGDTGRTFPNTVSFATHAAFNSTVTAVLVDTRIALRDTTFAKYHFVITDNTGSYTLFGDIYGANASPRDGTGKTVTVTAGANGMRLTLAPFSHPTGSYTCTGTVQLLT